MNEEKLEQEMGNNKISKEDNDCRGFENNGKELKQDKKVVETEEDKKEFRQRGESSEEEVQIDEQQDEKEDTMKEGEELEAEEEEITLEEEQIEKEENEDEKAEEVLKERIEELESTVEELEGENESYYKNLSRLKADFNNYRRRIEKEKEGLLLEGKIELVEEILPIIDNFERALSSEEEDSEFREGIEMIYRQLVNTLKQEGLEVIPAEGEPFDHRCHEAIMQVEDTEEESGIIVEELQKGYMFDNKVIRPSMVKVAE